MNAIKALADHVEALGCARELIEELARRGAAGHPQTWLEAVREVVRAELQRSGAAAETAGGDGLLSVGQAARFAGLAPATIREWCGSGRLRTAGRAGRRWRIRREDLEAALRAPSAQLERVDLDREAGRLLELDRARRRR